MCSPVDLLVNLSFSRSGGGGGGGGGGQILQNPENPPPGYGLVKVALVQLCDYVLAMHTFLWGNHR